MTAARPPRMPSVFASLVPVGALAVAGVAVALAGCRRSVTQQECARMLERYVEMSLARDPGFAHMPPEQADAAREMARATKVAEPSYALVQRQCEREVGRSEYRCAVAAKSPEEWEACID